MRVAFILYGEADSRSGGFLYDLYLIKKFESCGHEIKVFSQKEGCFFKLILGNSKVLYDTIIHFNPDVIIEDELNHSSLFIINKKLKAGTNVPIVSIVHHLKSEEKICFLWRMVIKRIEYIYLNRCTHYIFNSNNTCTSTMKLLKKKIENYTIVYPGKDNLSVKLRQKNENTALNFVFIGNLIPRKNLDMVLKVLSSFKEKSWRFTICGEESLNKGYVNKLHKIAENFESGKIIFTGRVSDAQLSDILSKSDILLAPSLWEGFGIIYLEALRAGVIPVASHYGGAVEIIDDGVNGFLVSSAADLKLLLEKLLNNPDRVRAMSKRLKNAENQFATWDQTMSSAVSYIEGLVY